MNTYSHLKSSAWYSERNLAIVAAYRSGEKIAQIAKNTQLDVETVRQILRGYGLKKTRGWW